MNRIPFIVFFTFFFLGFFLVKNLDAWERRRLPLCLILASGHWVREPLEAQHSLGRDTVTPTEFALVLAPISILCCDRIWVSTNIVIRKRRNYF